MGAFSVFFTQNPSFLDSQRNLEVTQGCSNARSLFGMTRTPSDNHIRNLLDPVPPSTMFPVFSQAVDTLHELGHLEPYRSINGDLLMALDGTQYFSSSKIHCENCSVKNHRNGTVTYSHTVVTPVIVASCNPRVIPLESEFITPQDGHKKQDCENVAAKRWLSAYGARYAALGVTVLGDDLYCKQPLCEAFIHEGQNQGVPPDPHNGHGEKHLYSLLATFNILAFLFHTLLNLMDARYRCIREFLPRKRFFNDLRRLTCYLCFDSWDVLMGFMIEKLELDVPDTG